MRVCQRCLKRISDDRTICPDCGSILEEVHDDELPRETITTRSPDRSEQESCDGLESPADHTSDALIADESSFVESEVRQVDKAEGPEWKCDQCGEMVPGTFDVCWNCTGVDDAVFQREDDAVPSEVDVTPEAMVCPFCGNKMNRGHIWMSGGDGSGVLEWQEGCRIRRGLFGKIADATLFSEGLLVAPAAQAFRCSSCGALLTNFKDPN